MAHLALALAPAVIIVAAAWLILLHDWHNPDTCPACAARNLARI